MGEENRTIDGADGPAGGRLALAAATWDELVTLAERRDVDEYGQLGERVGQRFPLAMRFPLDKVYWYCEREGLPPLSVLAINKDTRMPGAGFGRITSERFRELREDVFNFDWRTAPNPFGFARVRVGGADPVRRLLDFPDDAEEVYRSVRDRGRGQMLFREAVLHVYGRRCAATGSTIHAGLEAAHIVPWSVATPDLRLSVRNGILLTAWHHRLFDAGIFTLADDFTFRVRTGAGRGSPFDGDALRDLHGRAMRLPRRRDHRPDPALIRRRNELFAYRES